MQDVVRRRVIRNFVASLLTSDLTRSEILELIEELYSGRLARELADVLKDVGVILRDEPSYYPSVSKSEPSWEDLAYEFVQRRKMSRKALLNMMGAAGPKPIKALSDATIRQLLEWYFGAASPSQAAKLLDMLSGTKQDPYLKGIVGRD